VVTKTTPWEHVKKDVLENYRDYLRGDGKAGRTIDSYYWIEVVNSCGLVSFYHNVQESANVK
jgi:hypothetical protein